VTAAKAAPRKRPEKRTKTTPSKRSAPVKAAKTPAKKGAAPAKKAAKRASTGSKRVPAGAKLTPGAQLIADLTQKGDPVGVTVLIRQAGRTMDRLEQINAVLSGDGETWLKLSLPRSDAKRGRIWIECKVDGLLVEERNLTTLLRHVLREIDRQRGGNGGGNGEPEDDDLVD
jgi:hypothetical protein